MHKKNRRTIVYTGNQILMEHTKCEQTGAAQVLCTHCEFVPLWARYTLERLETFQWHL
jgi:hypothetical protein